MDFLCEGGRKPIFKEKLHLRCTPGIGAGTRSVHLVHGACREHETPNKFCKERIPTVFEVVKELNVSSFDLMFKSQHTPMT